MAGIEALTLHELAQLAQRLTVEIRVREQRDALLHSMQALARSHGFTLDEVLEGADTALLARRTIRHPATTPGRRAPVRYMHPSNRALHWSGRGRTPAWIKAWMSTGGSLTALENAAQKLAPRQAHP